MLPATSLPTTMVRPEKVAKAAMTSRMSASWYVTVMRGWSDAIEADDSLYAGCELVEDSRADGSSWRVMLASGVTGLYESTGSLFGAAFVSGALYSATLVSAGFA